MEKVVEDKLVSSILGEDDLSNVEPPPPWSVGHPVGCRCRAFSFGMMRASNHGKPNPELEPSQKWARAYPIA
jgi:hypothetical protein